MTSILITGGAGFIGTNLLRYLLPKYPHYHFITLDALSYAGNLSSLKDVLNSPNHNFVKGDICDKDLLCRLFAEYKFDGVIHLAAESHVDRSIRDPFAFVHTNVFGTLMLLEVAKEFWSKSFEGKRFYHVSTDEVYGSLSIGEASFTEETRYDPRSPYSASKASSDHFVRAYHHTYGLPILISNCSNNYGAYQFPEKLIPLFINNIIHNKPLPVYGHGENIRDWLYVEDHCRAIDVIYHRGQNGATYNIGGGNERRNIDLVHRLIAVVDQALGRKSGHSLGLISYVQDRQGHDLRYAIDSHKLRSELGWRPNVTFEEGLERTVRWYLDNTAWLDEVTSGAYQEYYAKMYQC